MESEAVKRLLILPSLLQAQLDVFTIAMASLLPNRSLVLVMCANCHRTQTERQLDWHSDEKEFG